MTPTGGEPPLRLAAQVLHPGSAAGPLLRLDEPVSFWGGVSADGDVIDAHHPQRGTSLSGAVVAMTAGRGSSSSSSVLAELIRSGAGPAAIVLTEPDAILVLGAAVAAELYDTFLPIVALASADFAALPATGRAEISLDTSPAARHGGTQSETQYPSATITVVPS